MDFPESRVALPAMAFQGTEQTLGLAQIFFFSPEEFRINSFTQKLYLGAWPDTKIRLN